MPSTDTGAPPPPAGAATFTTESFRDWEEFWQGGARRVIPLRAERRSEAPFRAGVSHHLASDRLVASRLWSTPHRMVRDGSDPEGFYFLGHIDEGRLVTTFKGRKPEVWDERTLSFGVPCDPYEQAIHAGGQGVARVTLWQVSRKLVDALVRRVPQPSVVVPCTGPGALVAAYLRDLTPRLHALDATALALFEQQLAALLALAVDLRPDARDLGRAALRKAQLDRALALVERRLHDPGLSPASAADALGISLRYLHRLFEEHGATFSRAVLERRLAAAHRLVTSPGARHRTILEIAFACGFNGASTFHRAFRAAYGVTPGDLRPR